MIYIAHPYGGKPRNRNNIEKIILNLTTTSTNTFVSPVHAFGFMYNLVSYDQGMLYCLELLEKCDSAIFCSGWEKSIGCRQEMEYCKRYNKPFIILKEDPL